MAAVSALLLAPQPWRTCLSHVRAACSAQFSMSSMMHEALRLDQRTMCTQPTEKTTYSAEGIPLRTGRPRLVVLGTGWAAARLLRDINPKLYDLTGSTFGIPGVEQYANFLREVKHGADIRGKLINNIALAGVPGRSVEDWFRLLHIVIVGGGPTGVEVAGELSDFISRDLRGLYPERARAMRITLIEAKELLGSFDTTLREYAARKLTRAGVFLRKGVVRSMDDKEITLTDGAVIPYGLCIWSTGVGPTKFVQSMPFAHAPTGRLAVDDYMRVLGNPEQDQQGKAADGKAPVTHSTTPADFPVVPDVYALGDCCTPLGVPLPALAQVAEQQGKYLAKVLNHTATAVAKGEEYHPPEFVYRPLGAMVTVGGHKALLELNMKPRNIPFAGFLSWVAWRSAYLTRLGSITNRLQVAFNWTITLFFGRDMSRF